MNLGLVLHLFIVVALVVSVTLGAGALSLILWSIWRGAREMGDCRHNSNQLGTDISYSDLHADEVNSAKPKMS